VKNSPNYSDIACDFCAFVNPCIPENSSDIPGHKRILRYYHVAVISSDISRDLSANVNVAV